MSNQPKWITRQSELGSRIIEKFRPILRRYVKRHISISSFTTSRSCYSKGSDDTKIPTFDDLDKFLESHARALEELTINVNKTARSQKVTSTTASAMPNIICPLCKASHFINKCLKFVKKRLSQRIEIIKQHNCCINCLSSKYAVQSCSRKYSYRTCHKKRHSMLHNDSGSSSEKNNALIAISKSEESDAAPITTLYSTTEVPSRPSVLLATARVKVSSSEGRALEVRALRVDQGSEIMFITARLSQTLKLQRIKMPNH